MFVSQVAPQDQEKRQDNPQSVPPGGGSQTYPRLDPNDPNHKRFLGWAEDPANAEEVQRLDSELTALAGNVNAAQARLLDLIGEMDAGRVWAELFCKSASHWLQWRFGYSAADAQEHLRVARALRELPSTRAAFERGELSFSQIRAITHVAEASTEQDFLHVARYTTGGQFAQVMRAYRKARRIEISEAEGLRRKRRLNTSYDADGMYRIWGCLPPEEGAIVDKALERARNEMRAEIQKGAADGSRDADEPWAASQADALVAMAESFLRTGMPNGSPGDSYQVMVHIDADALRSDTGELCELANGIGLASETVRLLACEAGIIGMLEENGSPLSVGRMSRRPTRRIRRAVMARDRCCSYPGCTQTRFLATHHVQHWGHDGPTSEDNLVALCPVHHKQLHAGRYRILMQPGGPVFLTPEGAEIPAVPRPPAAQRSIEADNRSEGHNIDDDACLNEYCGDRMQGNYVADVLLMGHYQDRRQRDGPA